MLVLENMEHENYVNNLCLTPLIRKRGGGMGGIRTRGRFPYVRFRAECLKPDSATLPCINKRMEDFVETSRFYALTGCVARKIHPISKLVKIKSREQSFLRK